MKLTNRLGLPGALTKAVQGYQNNYKQSYTKKADISVTSLISPPQQRVLFDNHGGEITEDVSDRIWALMGQAVHEILEKSETSSQVEERLYSSYDGWLLSGQYDRQTLSGKTLQDYKFTSVWEVIHGLKPEREAQLNILRNLANRNGYAVDYLEIVAIFRDWQKSKAKFDKNYPQTQVMRIKVPVWDDAHCLSYISERIRLHKAAKNGIIMPCSDEERWAVPEKWAVRKKKNKKATKLWDSKKLAFEHAETNKDFVVEHRPGANKRCDDYCNVSEFCNQYKQLKG